MVLYPEVEAAGTLLAAFRDVLGPDVHLEEMPAWPGRNVVARGRDRSVDTVLGSEKRVFLLQFWARRIHYASGQTADLAAAAGAARDWVAGATPDAMRAAWPFARFGDCADACERGEGVEYMWQQYFAYRDRAPQLVPLRRFIELAMAEPRLRSRYPFTSHGTLGLRPAAEPSPSLGVWVTPGRDGGFRVRGPDREEVRVPDAEAAVARVVSLIG